MEAGVGPHPRSESARGLGLYSRDFGGADKLVLELASWSTTAGGKAETVRSIGRPWILEGEPDSHRHRDQEPSGWIDHPAFDLADRRSPRWERLGVRYQSGRVAQCWLRSDGGDPDVTIWIDILIDIAVNKAIQLYGQNHGNTSCCTYG